MNEPPVIPRAIEQGLKIEIALPSGIAAQLIIPLSATHGDLMVLAAAILRELPVALAQQRSPAARILVPHA